MGKYITKLTSIKPVSSFDTVFANHINQLAYMIPPIEKEARNLIYTDQPVVYDGTNEYRRSLIFQDYDIEVPSINTAYIDVDIPLKDNDGKDLAVWADNNTAISTEVFATQGEYDQTVPGVNYQIIGINGSKAKMRIYNPSVYIRDNFETIAKDNDGWIYIVTKGTTRTIYKFSSDMEFYGSISLAETDQMPSIRDMAVMECGDYLILTRPYGTNEGKLLRFGSGGELISSSFIDDKYLYLVSAICVDENDNIYIARNYSSAYNTKSVGINSYIIQFNSSGTYVTNMKLPCPNYGCRVDSLLWYERALYGGRVDAVTIKEPLKWPSGYRPVPIIFTVDLSSKTITDTKINTTCGGMESLSISTYLTLPSVSWVSKMDPPIAPYRGIVDSETSTSILYISMLSSTPSTINRTFTNKIYGAELKDKIYLASDQGAGPYTVKTVNMDLTDGTDLMPGSSKLSAKVRITCVTNVNPLSVTNKQVTVLSGANTVSLNNLSAWTREGSIAVIKPGPIKQTGITPFGYGAMKASDWANPSYLSDVSTDMLQNGLTCVGTAAVNSAFIDPPICSIYLPGIWTNIIGDNFHDIIDAAGSSSVPNAPSFGGITASLPILTAEGLFPRVVDNDICAVSFDYAAHLICSNGDTNYDSIDLNFYTFIMFLDGSNTPLSVNGRLRYDIRVCSILDKTEGFYIAAGTRRYKSTSRAGSLATYRTTIQIPQGAAAVRLGFIPICSSFTRKADPFSNIGEIGGVFINNINVVQQ